MQQGSWTEQEQNELLFAINHFSNISEIVAHMKTNSERSEH